jgi:hypothetical protein
VVEEEERTERRREGRKEMKKKTKKKYLIKVFVNESDMKRGPSESKKNQKNQILNSKKSKNSK